MLAVRVYDVVLWLHILAVVATFGVSFAYPFMLVRVARAPLASRAFFHRLQADIGQKWISPGMIVVFVAGAYLATDADVWSEAWVTVPLVILIALGAMGGALLNPTEKRLADAADAGDEAAYGTLIGKLRGYVSLALLLLVVAIFFMTVKPFA